MSLDLDVEGQDHANPSSAGGDNIYVQKTEGLWERKGRPPPTPHPVSSVPAASSSDANSDAPSQKLKWKHRIRHFTWTWFTMTMATGGITNVLYHVQPRFPGLYAIGLIFLFLHIIEFIFNCVMISLRFYMYPSTFRASLTHPTESLFAPAFVISIATIIINITQYGLEVGRTGPWLVTVMIALYWVYVALAVLFSCGIFLLMWSTQVFMISQMTPVWIFPAYPLLLVGPLAGDLVEHVSGDGAVQIIVSGVILQGIGFMVSLMVYSAYLYRLMTQKLPQDSARPAMFISVGPSGFTISGLINMAYYCPQVVTPNFMGNGELTGQVSKILAYWVGIWLWGLALWFCMVSIGAHWSAIRRGKMQFAMTWWSTVFPNTALTTATFAVAKALDENRPIMIIGCVMACLVIIVWLIVNFIMIRAVLQRKVLWPQMQEDKDYDLEEERHWRKRTHKIRMFTSEHLATLRSSRPGPVRKSSSSSASPSTAKALKSAT